jgi:hypothetical protein
METNTASKPTIRKPKGWRSPCGRFGVFYAPLSGADAAATPWHACDATLDVQGDIATFGWGFATRAEAIAATKAVS